jgi:L-threonylcarbamoyladenylate synthase
VAIPTETVYGLAANAFNSDAVLKVFQVKQRPSFDPLIVHVGRKEDAGRIFSKIPKEAEALIERFWPGPLTLVLRKSQVIPDIVTSGMDTVGVRMPDHPLTLQLLRSLPFPLAAPSANPFGYISPTTAEHVLAQLSGSIPYVLDGGPCKVGVESTIIGVEEGRWTLYRAGGIPVELIEDVIGKVDPSVGKILPVAPGMLASHYAPRKPLHVGNIQELMHRFNGKRIGIISFKQSYSVEECEVLSPAGDIAEAAKDLFSAMRRLDASSVDVILAESFPSTGLGRAINDRLQRASVR